MICLPLCVCVCVSVSLSLFQDLLATDWAACSASGPGDVAAAVSPCALRASSVAHREPEKIGAQQAGEGSASACNGTASRSSTHTAAGQTVAALGLRQFSTSSSSSSSPHPPTSSHSGPGLAPQQRDAAVHVPPAPCAAQDDFDDWDVDLADLDECESQMGQPPPPPAPVAAVSTAQPSSSAKMLRPSSCRGIPTPPSRASCSTASSSHHPSPRGFSVPQAPPPDPRPSPSARPGLSATSSIPRTAHRPQEPHKPWTAPRPPPQTRGLFETVSPGPAPSPALNPHPLHTPVLTNRLVQLVSASSKLPRKRPRSDSHQPRTRRFPGPAGLLPHQPQDLNLDQIVVSAPPTPAHGVIARLPSQASSSQTEEEDFSGGPWAAMKADMGLDERNPSCFLHSYSVVMVLRKAALKQLARNKVPNMAVLLKSIIHTQADAKAVFKDPTGEIQGTVHRRLLEDRAEELKVGAVLLLKQVGVFSPSHRNHYLNVTPNNLLRIYAPDGVSCSSSSSSSSWLDPASVQPSARPADDDLDELLGELPEESYAL
uniref:Si:dkey-260c8.8 n=1 Tax=Salarias fasciatus TaxID=181472 RepID=A0A672H569_SALFA